MYSCTSNLGALPVVLAADIYHLHSGSSREKIPIIRAFLISGCVADGAPVAAPVAAPVVAPTPVNTTGVGRLKWQ